MKLLVAFASVILFAVLFWTCNAKIETTYDDELDEEAGEIAEMKIDNLLRETLALDDSLEVILSYLSLPKNTTLPTHFHPGEEFAYIIEGSGELTMKDESKVIMSSGSAGRIPLMKVHSFSTLDEPAKLVVFRVHKKGEPERVLVE